jgi:hypothetical protein
VITIVSNDPDEAPFAFTVEGFGTNSRPIITLIGPAGQRNNGGPAYPMGSIEVGGTLTATFSIENSGTGDLTVSSITESSAVFSILSAPTSPIPPGGSDDFRVRFQPTATGTFSTAVTIASDAINVSSFILNVSAVAVTTAPPAAPEIEIFGGRNLDLPIASGDSNPRRADGTDIGQSQVGEMVQRTFRIRNTGNAALPLSSARLINEAGNLQSLSVPASISAGGFADFTVSVSSSSPGVKNYLVQVTSQDADEGNYLFRLTQEVLVPNYPLQITESLVDGADFEITFVSDPAKTYRIAWSTDLQTWHRPAVLSAIPGDAAPQPYTLVNARSIVGPKGYFRVEEE